MRCHGSACRDGQDAEQDEQGSEQEAAGGDGAVEGKHLPAFIAVVIVVEHVISPL